MLKWLREQVKADKPWEGGIAEYAYGYTDKKPWGALVIGGLMAAYVIYRFWEMG